MGLKQLHWVTEWQRRGVPHLHGIAYFAPDFGGAVPRGGSWNATIVHHWLESAWDYNPSPRAQHVAVVTDVMGWLQYLAKHLSRGIRHYQRSRKNIPAGWKGKTGRVWGKAGKWPTREPMEFEWSRHVFWILRRWLRAWRRADARREHHPEVRRRRIDSSRRMLRCPNRRLSPVRGVSEWCPPELVLRMLAELHRQGHSIEHRVSSPVT